MIKQPDELAQLRVQVATLTARLAELEAPPVVPEGWEVDRRDDLWTLLMVYEGEDITRSPCAYIDRDGWLCTYDGDVPWAALVALEYAHRTDQRPPHAGDAAGGEL